MSKRHKPYSKDSRTTIWRRNLPGDASGCSCLYHSFANNWDRDSRCFCEYHEAAQNESNDECVCPYHEAATTEAVRYCFAVIMSIALRINYLHSFLVDVTRIWHNLTPSKILIHTSQKMMNVLLLQIQQRRYVTVNYINYLWFLILKYLQLYDSN